MNPSVGQRVAAIIKNSDAEDKALNNAPAFFALSSIADAIKQESETQDAKSLLDQMKLLTAALNAHRAALARPVRIAYTLKETADMLGVSYITVYRLVQRGKLKVCGDLRTKLISLKEIERFVSGGK